MRHLLPYQVEAERGCYIPLGSELRLGGRCTESTAMLADCYVTFGKFRHCKYAMVPTLCHCALTELKQLARHASSSQGLIQDVIATLLHA
jgi:hypothetical protein